MLVLALVSSMTLVAPPSLRCGAIDAKMVRYVPPATARGLNPLFRLVGAPSAPVANAAAAPPPKASPLPPFDCSVLHARTAPAPR